MHSAYLFVKAMKVSKIMISTLKDLGFIDGDPVKDLSDKPIKGLVYLTRVYKGQYQYLSLCYSHIEDRFLEAILHVYAKPFDSRSKVKQPFLAALIMRTTEDILVAVDTVYPPPPRPGKI